MKLFTIGFTKKNAEHFFSRLKQQGVTKVVDTRLNNVSQLAGFTKKDDLKFFLREICGIDYVHMPLLAPTKDILDAFKKQGGDWSVYEEQFNTLIRSRNIAERLAPADLNGSCLLCSEPTPHHCHRRLVAEYLEREWSDVEIKHL